MLTSNVLPLSVLIITYNEEDNIQRTLDSLYWVSNIFIVDSKSTDKTLDIIANYASVKLISRKFDSFATQCNYGLEHIQTSWVLSIDADFIVTNKLSNEVASKLANSDNIEESGFLVPIRYCIGGRPIRGTIYPPRTCLYRTSSASYKDEGHGHRVEIIGKVGRLTGEIYHDDRKPISRWLKTQQTYMEIEAKHLLQTPSNHLSRADLIRKHSPIAPLAALFICLIWKCAFLDGWRGWAYAIQRMYAETLLLVILLDSRLSRHN
jgi:glycosyltransferase involved in cell wall biosynthesis